MSKHGQYSFAIGKEMDRKLAAIKSIALGMYGGKNCKKLQRIHVAVTDPYNVKRVRMGNARCPVRRPHLQRPDGRGQGGLPPLRQGVPEVGVRRPSHQGIDPGGA